MFDDSTRDTRPSRRDNHLASHDSAFTFPKAAPRRQPEPFLTPFEVLIVLASGTLGFMVTTLVVRILRAHGVL